MKPARRSDCGPARRVWPRPSSFARAGHAVVVFEKNDRIGGLLRYGIPDQDGKSLIDMRMEQMAAEGAEFPRRIHIGNTDVPRGVKNYARERISPGATDRATSSG